MSDLPDPTMPPPCPAPDSGTTAALVRWAKAYAAKMVLAERERCAAIAEKTVCDTHLPTGIRIYGTAAAKAIRASHACMIRDSDPSQTVRRAAAEVQEVGSNSLPIWD